MSRSLRSRLSLTNSRCLYHKVNRLSPTSRDRLTSYPLVSGRWFGVHTVLRLPSGLILYSRRRCTPLVRCTVDRLIFLVVLSLLFHRNKRFISSAIAYYNSNNNNNNDNNNTDLPSVIYKITMYRLTSVICLCPHNTHIHVDACRLAGGGGAASSTGDNNWVNRTIITSVVSLMGKYTCCEWAETIYSLYLMLCYLMGCMFRRSVTWSLSSIRYN